MRAKSVKGKTIHDIENALLELPGDFKPTLAFVFLSVRQDRDAVARLLNRFSISVFGATTNGEFIDEDYEQGTIAILLLDVNPAYFFIQFAELDGTNDRATTSSMAKDAIARFDDPAFVIMGSSLGTDVEEVLGGFVDVLGKDANIVGGMAGDDHTFK
ncbi:MAG: FIST N-terminal domain-containing protein, partial [Flavisolibacter sp.]